MPTYHYKLTESMLADKADWNDLSLDFQRAALDVWLHQGKAAVLLFCHGA